MGPLQDPQVLGKMVKPSNSLNHRETHIVYPCHAGGGGTSVRVPPSSICASLPPSDSPFLAQMQIPVLVRVLTEHGTSRLYLYIDLTIRRFILRNWLM